MAVVATVVAAMRGAEASTVAEVVDLVVAGVDTAVVDTGKRFAKRSK